MICTFFGHRDCPAWVEERLEAMVEELIRSKGVDVFYVGDQGAFDKMVQRVLRRVKEKFPSLSAFVVLQAVPQKPVSAGLASFVPEGIENVPPRFAISHRNRWMVAHSDVVVAYVVRTVGGAAQFVSAAQKAGKQVLFLKK